MLDPVLYDGDAALAALDRPQVKVRGRVRTGVFLSIEEFRLACAWWVQLCTDGLPPADYRAGFRRLVDGIFPPSRLERLARRLPAWWPVRWRPVSVAEFLEAMPFKPQSEAIQSFLNRLAPAYSAETEPSPTPAPTPASGTTRTSETLASDSGSPSATGSPASTSAIPVPIAT